MNALANSMYTDYPVAIASILDALKTQPGDCLLTKIARYSDAISKLDKLIPLMKIDADVASLKAINTAIAIINLANMNFIDNAKRSTEKGAYQAALDLMQVVVAVALKKDELFNKRHPFYFRNQSH
jgi:hypothetical protein